MRSEPARLGGIVARREVATDHHRLEVSDVEVAAAYLDQLSADLHLQPGFLGHLASGGRGRGLAGLDPATGHGPGSSRRGIAAAYQQQPALTVAHDRSRAGDPRAGHEDHASGRLTRGHGVEDRFGVGQPPTCPRCAGELRPPGLWHSAWECAEHGSVAPFHVMQRAGLEELQHVSARCGVPVWLPSGLGPAWSYCGIGYAGDDREPARASAVVARGPGPIGGEAELVVVAEEPGVGLGARLAGYPDIDPGEWIAAGPPDGRVAAARHPAPLWPIHGASDRAAFVGEAAGCWLWLVVWPVTAGVVIYDGIELHDHRDPDALVGELAFGPLSTRLAA